VRVQRSDSLLTMPPLQEARGTGAVGPGSPEAPLPFFDAGQLLVIAPEAFMEAAAPLIAHKNNTGIS
jgi:hypothetical protein